ncbi:UNVERIFIED_CONTAM: putative E3 ubiquitin-protein ligase HERC6 [Sesamum latifolium]|uniref:E3 ubiquitin-protein ligase HERC6 n=1 Tax=Sesamum latifolium TaxID=2727402 RepID=A0AAW2TPR8_9LAMI
MLRFFNRRNRSPSGLLIGLAGRWMSSKTTVMSFGDGSQGALGLAASPMGLGCDAYEPTPIPGLPPDVCSLTAGHYHSIAVTSQGQLWAWGRNSELQLGRGQLSPRETWSKPQKVERLNQVRIQAAFASGVISAAIGDDGTLWVWGKSKRGQLGLGKDVTEAVLPARVESLLGQEIVKVSLGWGHTLALTKDGKLFGWGYYADGRLGKIGKSLEASPLDSVAEKLYSSSENSNLMVETAERLVLEAIEKEKEMPVIWEPTLVEELFDVEVVDVACGLDHSLICAALFGDLQNTSSESGEDSRSVVTWGWNQSSQLGREGSENVPLVSTVWSKWPARIGSSVDEPGPMLVECLEGREVYKLSQGLIIILFWLLNNVK